MRKFLAIKINCTLNTYFPRPRLKRRTFLDWPPSGGRGKAYRETAAFAIFEGHGFIPRLEQNEEVLFFSKVQIIFIAKNFLIKEPLW